MLPDVPDGRIHKPWQIVLDRHAGIYAALVLQWLNFRLVGVHLEDVRAACCLSLPRRPRSQRGR